MTLVELQTTLEAQVRGFSDDLGEGDYTNAITEALREVVCAFPVTDAAKVLWLQRRAKRHLLFLIALDFSSNYRIDNVHKQQRFDNLLRLIQNEDKAWEKALEDDPMLGVDVDASELFGTAVTTGFAYDSLGRDRTYDDDQLVGITPGDVG